MPECYIFDIGETVICSITLRDASGSLQDAVTSMTIVINRLHPTTEIIASTAMDNDSTGTYHYDFASASNDAADYEAVYTATDGTRITIAKDGFKLR